MSQKLKVTEHRNTHNPSEVVRVDIPGGYSVVVEFLGSQGCTVVDMCYEDGYRTRVENIYHTSDQLKDEEDETQT